MKYDDLKLRIRSVGFYFIFCCFFCTTVGAAQPQTRLVSYADLKGFIQTQNGLIQSSQSVINAAEVRTGYLKRSFLPQVNVAAGSEAFQTAGLSTQVQPLGEVDISWNLFRGGRDQKEESIRQAQLQVAKEQGRATQMSELLKAQDLYWEIVAISELMTQTQDIIKLNNTGLQSTKKRLSRGLLTPADVKAFEIYQDILDEKITSLSHEKMLLLMTLKPILGLSDTESIALTDLKVPYSSQEVDDPSLSMMNHPEIQQLLRHQEMTTLQKDKLQQQYRPSIDAFGTYALYTSRERTFSTMADRTDIVAGIRMQMPLFNGFQNTKEKESLDYRAEALAQSSQQQLLSLVAELKTTQEELQHLDELVQRSEKRLGHIKVYIQLMVEDYDRGVKNSSDLLTAIEAYANHLEEWLTHRREYQKTKSQLLGLVQLADSEDQRILD